MAMRVVRVPFFLRYQYHPQPFQVTRFKWSAICAGHFPSGCSIMSVIRAGDHAIRALYTIISYLFPKTVGQPPPPEWQLGARWNRSDKLLAAKTRAFKTCHLFHVEKWGKKGMCKTASNMQHFFLFSALANNWPIKSKVFPVEGGGFWAQNPISSAPLFTRPLASNWWPLHARRTFCGHLRAAF